MKLMNAKGVRDFPPEEKIIRQKVVDTLRETFEEFGFNPLETPEIERFETLSSKYAGGDEILKEIFKLKDQGGRKLGLRYDLTIPLARFIGMNPNLKMPFKRYEIGRVYRDGPIKLGRYREFWQCDVDTVGSKSMLADAEILAIADRGFKKLGLKTVIKINNRKILDGILLSTGVKENKWIDAILSIDKLEKQGKNEVKKELEQKKIASTSKIFKLIQKKENNKKTLDNLKSFISNDIGKEGIAEMEELLKLLKSFKVSVDFDPSLARGLAYYTGPVYEVFLEKSEIKSSIAAGGRYDEMVGKFVGKEDAYPATGISFGLEVITDALSSKEKKKSVVDVYVIPIKTTSESIKIAQKLRNSGIKIDMDISGRGISKNLNYANALDIPYVIFVGEKELKQKKVKLRDMKTGKEQLLSINNLVKKLKK
ncbi:MAG: histidine--tRNA ligase [Nanoarchaeota archaeon]|nr:histidine--tRNA ligase [DPANN group archaeon]MBL7117146.1 histidine--tRNA ligase [Nanoarchaeota archaeon]